MAQDVTLQLFLDGGWWIYPGYSADGWETEIGPSEETGTKSSKIKGTFQNDDLSLDPYNAASPLYGKIGRNTRMRLRAPGTTTLTQAEVSSWEPQRTVDHKPGLGVGRSWVDVQAEGVLRRLNKWEDNLRSPMVRQTLSYPLLGYWPGEDGSDADQVSNLAGSGVAGNAFGGVDYAGADGPAGSEKLLKIDATGSVTGAFARPPAGFSSGWQVGFTMKLDALPPSIAYKPLVRWTTTAGHIYTFGASNGSFEVLITTADGTVLDSQIALFGTGILPTRWMSYRIKVTDTGSNVTVEPAWYDANGVVWGFTDTFTAAAPGVLVDWTCVGDNVTFGHMFASYDTTVDLQTYDAIQSFNGYKGERALSRYIRMCAEEGVSAYTLGLIADTPQMGVQRPGRFLDLLEECARTDGGLIYDEPIDIALRFRTRIHRMQSTSVLDLTYPTHITTPLRRVTDDTGVNNYVTVSNPDKGSATAELTTGRMSVLPPPNGIGRVKTNIDVNLLSDTALATRADWELAKRTIDRPRYPTVTIDLQANPGLIAGVNALRPGDLITITGLEPDPVKLHVLNIAQAGQSHTRTATLTCLPAEVWGVGVYDAATALYDSATTTLAGAETTTDVSLGLTTELAADVWPTTGYPRDLMITGERVRVTAMSAAAGTGPFTQTATVTRSVNGVVKAHLAGEEVHLADPVRYA